MFVNQLSLLLVFRYFLRQHWSISDEIIQAAGADRWPYVPANICVVERACSGAASRDKSPLCVCVKQMFGSCCDKQNAGTACDSPEKRHYYTIT